MAGHPIEKTISVSQSSNHHVASPTPNFRPTAIDAVSIEAESNRRKQHFRSLVSDIAEHLDERDVNKIIWQKELPQKMKDKPALAVLEWLYSHGAYSADEVRPLTQLLKAIHREDLTEKVETYQKKFGRHSSLPLNSPKPSLSTEKRANTLTGGESVATVSKIDKNCPHQESGHDYDDSDIQSVSIQNGSSPLPMPPEAPVVGDKAPSYSKQQQQFHKEARVMSSHQVHGSHDQAHRSHDQLHQSHDRAPRGHRIPKQKSFDQIEATHHPPTVMESHKMHRSSSSAAPVTLRPLNDQGNVSSDTLLNNIIHGQLAWKFNSNPSSSNVSQENILASLHSDVNVPTSSPRPPAQTHHSHAYNHHPHCHSSSNPLSQELQALLQNQSSPINSHHLMNHQIASPSFQQLRNFNEFAVSYTTQNSCPVHGTQSGRSLSQSSGYHCSVVQPYLSNEQQYVVTPHVSNGLYPGQEQSHPPHIQHHHSYSYNCAMDSSRSASRTSMRQLTSSTVAQPPQIFPTAYPSTQNIAQATYLSSLSYTPPRHSRQPSRTPTRQLSLVTPQDHTQPGYVPQRSSGYTTDGSGADDVFLQSHQEDHLLAAAPERSSTHPQVGPSAKSARHLRARMSHDPLLSDHVESNMVPSNRRTPASSGYSAGTRGSEASMEMPFVGVAGVGNSEKSGSIRHAWDVLTSQSGDLNDADSGFTGSAPHGINGENRRSFTPNTIAKLQTELKKLPLSQPSMACNTVNGFSHPSGTEASQKKNKRPSSHSFEQENRLREDSQSDDNFPIVYKDDDNCRKSSAVKRTKDRAITRGAIQYRSLRYERDRQTPRRGKPNRSSLQSFDGHTLDGLQLERAANRAKQHHVAPKSPGLVSGNGSVHSLKSKSSQEKLTVVSSAPQRRSPLQPGAGNHHHHQYTSEENGSPSANSKNTKSGGLSSKPRKSAGSESQPLDADFLDSSPLYARGTTAPVTKKSKLTAKLHRRSKPKPKLIRPDELVWPIKRDKLNKYIYESKYAKKPLQCKHKLELESGTGTRSSPKLKCELYPFGLEEDQNEYITIKVYVEQPKHCNLHSSTVIQITLNIFDCDSGDQIRQAYVFYESIRSSYFLIKQFVHHDLIKKSRCEFVEVQIQACLVDCEESDL